MNKVVLMGRLTRDPEVRYSQGENALAIARYTLAVDRRFKRDGEQTAGYTNRDGVKVYTTEVVVEEQEFAESKNASSANTQSYQAAPAPAPSADAGDGFMNIPDGIDEELPFN